MKHISKQQLEQAVSTIYADVERNVLMSVSDHAVAALWSELSTCLLSSQISFEMAVSASQRITDRKILCSRRRAPVEAIFFELRASLEEPMLVNERLVRYRFYNAKAAQLAKTWIAIEEFGGLEALISSLQEPHIIRDWLVKNAPGLGPKQASMFIRNIGLSYDLAILDRHVLKYMEFVGLCEVSQQHVAGLGGYLKLERTLANHASKIGCRVGLLDWAIWIVMRAARRVSEEAEAK
jgi:N-glycosylase/DNA lyase